MHVLQSIQARANIVLLHCSYLAHRNGRCHSGSAVGERPHPPACQAEACVAVLAFVTYEPLEPAWMA